MQHFAQFLLSKPANSTAVIINDICYKELGDYKKIQTPI